MLVAAAAAGCASETGDDIDLLSLPAGATGGTSSGVAGNEPSGGGAGRAGALGGTGGSGATGGAGARGSGAGTVGSGGSAAPGGRGPGGRGGAGGSGGGTQGSGGSVTAGGRGGRGFGGQGRGGGGATGGRGGSSGSAGSGAGNSGGGDACAATPLPSNGSSHCSSNQSGNVGSQQWTIWSSGGGGCLITYGSSAAFSATWNNSGDFLARVGLSLGSNKTYDQFGTLGADFSETKSGNGGGYSSIGVYGWSVSPLVEFYVVEDSFNRLGASGTKKGTFTIDGEGTYDVYVHTQVNQPSIQGTATFDQFISVRQSARTCGHISLTKHFDQWKKFGMTLGKMEEAKVLVEAGGGSGRIDFPVANVTAQ